MSDFFRHSLRFIVLIFIQFMVLIHIRIGNYVNPFIYPLFLMLLPFRIPHWLLLFMGFGTGFTVDLFMSTPGLHTSASVLLAFVRPYVVRLASGAPLPESASEPTVTEMGNRWFFSYSISLIFVHHLTLFLLESFDPAHLSDSIYRILLSVPVSETLILLLVFFFQTSRKR